MNQAHANGVSRATPLSSDAVRLRAMNALVGLAVGDALGMPTQLMSREDIRDDYGPITGLVAAGPRQVIAAGMQAGAVTDDTEQALMLARLLVEGGGRLDETTFATALLEWERNMAAKGSLDLLGPSTKRAVERISAGVPASEAGKDGSTNGAAMRITPVGIAVPPWPLERLIAAVVSASRVTHNTTIGLAAAAAVGTAVSLGLEGADLEESIGVAVQAADRAAICGNWVAGAHVGPKITWAIRHIRETHPDDWIRELDAVVGTDVPAQESVVAAFAIAAVAPSAWDAVCLAASVGGDTDTIAAIVGAVRGAHAGSGTWPTDVVDQVERVNAIAFAPVVDDLLRLRAVAETTEA